MYTRMDRYISSAICILMIILAVLFFAMAMVYIDRGRGWEGLSCVILSIITTYTALRERRII